MSDSPELRVAVQAATNLASALSRLEQARAQNLFTRSDAKHPKTPTLAEFLEILASETVDPSKADRLRALATQLRLDTR